MDCVQQTDEWLELRRNKIGSSDAPVIMGVSPWKTPYQLWEEKLGLRENGPIMPWMQRGLDLEETAREIFEKETGIYVFPKVIFHPTYPFMIASLDGMDIEGKAILEIKCPGKEDHAKAAAGEIPEKYIPQLQHQLEVSGLDMLYYMSYSTESWHILEVQRDPKYIKTLVAKERDFWACVETLESPKLTDKDFTLRDDDLWKHAATTWLKCQEELLILKAKEEELRENLVCLAGKKNAMGSGVKLSRVIRKGGIDYRSIPELDGVDLEAYRKASVESWRLSRE